MQWNLEPAFLMDASGCSLGASHFGQSNMIESSPFFMGQLTIEVRRRATKRRGRMVSMLLRYDECLDAFS